MDDGQITCRFRLGVDYVASDGNVIISRETATNAAVDPSTCLRLWQTPSEPDDDRVVIWKAGTGLIERTRRSDSITSLVPPA